LRGSAFGSLALSYLLGAGNAVGAPSGKGEVNPLAPKPPHHTPKAKSVIWLVMEGGPRHIDLFDSEPALEKLARQPMPESFGKVVTPMGTGNNALMPSKRQWNQHGQSGLRVSDWYPNVAQRSRRPASRRRPPWKS